eukprot:TRINITY_DN10275_c1_g1_i1.p1 TRINITY_DN10275_c1_g1~~TRINITY_DN10275_c1_g1_i1.p1  ORF type:complete len:408 (+),score=82.36 TRINITY_DN10275_c1_g1_i1:100-1224(+)
MEGGAAGGGGGAGARGREARWSGRRTAPASLSPLSSVGSTQFPAESPPPSPDAVQALNRLLDDCVHSALWGGVGFDEGFHFVDPSTTPYVPSAVPAQELAPQRDSQRAPLPDALREQVAALCAEWEPRRRMEPRRLSDGDLASLKRQLKQALRHFDINFEKELGRPPEKQDKHPLRAVYSYYKSLKNDLQRRGLANSQHPGQDDDDERQAPAAPPARQSARAEPPQSQSRQPQQGPQPQPPSQQPQPPLRPAPHHASPASVQAPAPAPAQPDPMENSLEEGGMPPTRSNTAPVLSHASEARAAAAANSHSPAEIAAMRQEKKVLKRRLFAFMAEFKEKNGREVKTREDRSPLATEYERYRVLKSILQEVDRGAA